MTKVRFCHHLLSFCNSLVKRSTIFRHASSVLILNTLTGTSLKGRIQLLQRATLLLAGTVCCLGCDRNLLILPGTLKVCAASERQAPPLFSFHPSQKAEALIRTLRSSRPTALLKRISSHGFFCLRGMVYSLRRTRATESRKKILKIEFSSFQRKHPTTKTRVSHNCNQRAFNSPDEYVVMLFLLCLEQPVRL